MLVPVQVILIAVAMVAFNQEWHVEEERPIGDELPPGDTPADNGGVGPHRLEAERLREPRHRPSHDRHEQEPRHYPPLHGDPPA